MRLRNIVPWLLLLLLLAALGLFAWMTQHPDHPGVEQAESWPVVGPLVAELRRAYLPPPAPEQAGGGTAEGAAGSAQRREDTLVLEPLETVWAAPGTAVHEAPDTNSPVLAEIERYAELTVFERRPAAAQRPGEHPANWYRVRHDSRGGWVRLTEPAPGEPLLGRAPEPVRAVPALSPDPERLERARALLGPDTGPGRLGPYELWTDLADTALTARLASVATQIEAAYLERYGLMPVGEPAEAVVLFARLADYRAYQRAEENLAGLPAAGHAGRGLVALYDGARRPEEVTATLMHELAHLLNRRAVGPALPPWLDEGMAEDFAWSRVGAAGRPEPGSWGGTVEVAGPSYHLTGGFAILQTTRRFADSLDQGRAPRLAELTALDWEGFVLTDRPVHYLHAGLLIRFLLDDPYRAAAFRAYLTETAAGEPLVRGRLHDTLGLPEEELEVAFQAWVRNLATEAEVLLEAVREEARKAQEAVE